MARVQGVLYLAGVLLTARAQAADELAFDGRDRYTLFERHLQTRQLDRQLADAEQSFRLFRGGDRLLVAGEFQIGTQQTYGHGTQTHFHGFAIADTFASLRLMPELSVGVNLLAFQPKRERWLPRLCHYQAGHCD